MAKYYVKNMETGEEWFINDSSTQKNQKPERDLDFEMRYGYDASIDYKGVQKRVCALKDAGYEDEAKALLWAHGGPFSLHCLIWYQKQMREQAE